MPYNPVHTLDGRGNVDQCEHSLHQVQLKYNEHAKHVVSMHEVLYTE